MSIELRRILEYYQALGVECPLLEEPVNRMLTGTRETSVDLAYPYRPAALASGQQGNAHPEARLPAHPKTLKASEPFSENQAAALARKKAQEASSLEALSAIIKDFKGCPLRWTAKSTVVYDGTKEADIMIIGEAPGRDEDREGVPFVGRSGQLMNKMFAAIGYPREALYITNLIPWRPPGNRTPTSFEIEVCRPFVERQIALVRPKVLVSMGASATRALLGLKQGIRSVRGKWSEYRLDETTRIAALPTYHPAYLLRQPLEKRLAWRDVLDIKSKLDQAGAPS